MAPACACVSGSRNLDAWGSSERAGGSFSASLAVSVFLWGWYHSVRNAQPSLWPVPSWQAEASEWTLPAAGLAFIHSGISLAASIFFLVFSWWVHPVSSPFSAVLVGREKEGRDLDVGAFPVPSL